MAARGRKPKPTARKKVTGNPGRRPLNAEEPKVRHTEEVPAPLAHLTAEAKREWKRRAPELHLAGLLSTVDLTAFGAYCEAFATWERANASINKMVARSQAGSMERLSNGLMTSTSNGNVIQNPLVGTRNKAMQDMVRYASEFGMTPSARSRIGNEPPITPGQAGGRGKEDDYFNDPDT